MAIAASTSRLLMPAYQTPIVWAQLSNRIQQRGCGAGRDADCRHLSGTAVGTIIGRLVCSRAVISRPIGDKLCFLSGIGETASHAAKQTRMIEWKIAPDRQLAAIMLRSALTEAKMQPDQFYHPSPA